MSACQPLSISGISARTLKVGSFLEGRVVPVQVLQPLVEQRVVVSDSLSAQLGRILEITHSDQGCT